MNKIKVMTILFGLLFIPLINVNALEVSTEEELKNAINDDSVTEIELAKDIDIKQTLVITKEKKIDGKNHSLIYTGLFKGGVTDKTVWGNNTDGKGVYIIQVYKTKATIKDINVTGGNAGLLINGSDVLLEGTIDVSGNGFGGIELGQGVNVSAVPNVTLNNVKLINTTETSDKPTIWIDASADVADKISITVDGKKLATTIVDGKVYAYLDETKAPNYVAPAPDKNENQTPVTNDVKNPETFDNTIIYIIFVTLGIALLIYGINRYTKEA